jgi:hypothetical protein
MRMRRHFTLGRVGVCLAGLFDFGLFLIAESKSCLDEYDAPVDGVWEGIMIEFGGSRSALSAFSSGTAPVALTISR